MNRTAAWAVVVGGAPTPPRRLVPVMDAPTHRTWGRCFADDDTDAYLRVRAPQAGVWIWIPVVWGRRATDPPGWCVDPTGTLWNTAQLPPGVTVWATVVAAARED